MAKFGHHVTVIPSWTSSLYVRKLGPHGLIFSPHPQCLPESLLIITLNSLCQAGCWVRKREQMSFQNAAPLSLPLLSNRREAEKEGRGQALTLPQVEEGQVAGTGPSAEFLPLGPKAQGSLPLCSTPSKGRSHHKSQNPGTSKADNVFSITAIHHRLTTCTIA